MTVDIGSSDYLDALRSKTFRSGERLYPEEVIENLSLRDSYLEGSLSLQKRADDLIIRVASQFGIEAQFPDGALNELTNSSLDRLSDLLATHRESHVFVAVAGPGGAGKDTVLENLESEMTSKEGGVRIGRIKKHTTRNSDRPGAYFFAADTAEFAEKIGEVKISDSQSTDLKEKFGIEPNESGNLGNVQLESIQSLVDSHPDMTEWNADLAVGSGIVELIYRSNRGWYATRLEDIVETVEDSDITFITGNPQNLSEIMKRVGESMPDVLPLFVYVMPGFPPQFISAARALLRDGLNQTDEQLLSTTGSRQIDEMEIFAHLLEDKGLDAEGVIVVENDKVLSEPGSEIKTEIGHKLGQIFKNHFDKK